MLESCMWLRGWPASSPLSLRTNGQKEGLRTRHGVFPRLFDASCAATGSCGGSGGAIVGRPDPPCDRDKPSGGSKGGRPLSALPAAHLGLQQRSASLSGAWEARRGASPL